MPQIVKKLFRNLTLTPNRVTLCLITNTQNILWKKLKFLGMELLVATEKQKRNLPDSALIFLLHSTWKSRPSWESWIIIDATSIIYQHEVLADRLHGLEKDHTDMLTQLHKYVNSLANVKLNSMLNQRLAIQLVVDNQPHTVLAFKPKPLSKDSTPDEFAIWKDNFEVYFTATNAHNCDTKIQSVFLNTCIDKFLVSTQKKHITDGMPVFSTSDAIPGHIQPLEQHFLTRFPMHIRRAEIFLFKPNDK